jgi:BirA family biotin operon repressor/biotin-[acetyl-CoA-carboxylase] ligase
LHKLFKNTVFIGKKAFFLPSCHSTNEMASALMCNEQPLNGTVVYTDFQTHGKGQRGNSWEAQDGKNILLSVILETSYVEATNFFDLTIMTSLAIRDILSEYIQDGVKIKWPNDMYFGSKKIAGILIENYIRQNAIEWCILGVGINVNQSKFREPDAVSMANICGQQFDREELVNMLLKNLENRYFQLEKGKTQNLRSEYLACLYWKDEIHVFQSEGTFFNGKIVGVDQSGKLMMEMEDGHRYFDFKEVSFVK